MAPDKSPGEDGFSARFYQTYWQIVGDDVSQLCLRILNDGASLDGLNHTLLALLPKIDNPQQVTDFRPISLCNVVYKLISKAIVNRLKTILPEVISRFQGAFVPGRCIYDNVITAFEVIHSIRARQVDGEQSCVLKLDISKAYDRVEWIFLDNILRRLGFSDGWVDLVMRCVQSVSFSVLWNGEAAGMIKSTRGLRQGDPLSPYLFLLCSEGFSGLLQKAERDGSLLGARVTNEGPTISHLLFADDSMLFSRANIHEVTFIKQCLLLYESAAGQKINYQKSAISFGPGIVEDQKEVMSQLLGIPIVPFHERYLGLPTIARRNRKEMFKRIHERLDFHLHGWQSKLLSKAGKTVLIKAVAQAIPTYAMSVFQLPKGVCRTYQSKVAKFWWGNGCNKRGIHWCKWEQLCRNMKVGGLGFRDITVFNQALLAKTLWRIVIHPNSVVNKVLQAKYVIEGNWAAALGGPKTSMVWRGLVWGKELLCAGVRWRIGSGENVKIWGDKWLPSPWTFKVVTPRFMAADATVNFLMSSPGRWNSDFISEHFLPLDVEKILSIPLCEKNVGDVVIWHYNNDGHYSVKSGYWLGMELKQLGMEGCSSGGLNEPNSVNVWSTFWSLPIPNKVKIFLWRACHSFLPCAERLFKRKIGNDASCFRCGGLKETVLHCIWECPKTRKVWKGTWLSGVLKILCIPSFIDLLARVLTEGGSNEIVQFCLISWWLWKDRNNEKHGKVPLQPVHLLSKCMEWQAEFTKTQLHKVSVKSITNLLDKGTAREGEGLQGMNWSGVRLFFDGACALEKGRTGLGAVILEAAGNLIGAAAIPIVGPLKPRSAEVLALWKGLWYCKQLRMDQVLITGDAINIIKALDDSGLDLSEDGGVLDAVRSLLKEFALVSWKHVRKRYNTVAHKLARQALSMVKCMFCKEVGPPWLHESIEASELSRNVGLCPG